MKEGPIEDELMARAEAGDRFSTALCVLFAAFKSFRSSHAPEAAAGIAYYTLFSIFPLLLILAAMASTLLEAEQVQQHVMTFLEKIIPTAQELIQENIQRLFDLRLKVGIVAVIGLLWSVTGVFTVLARNVDRAWHDAEPRNFLRWRLVSLVMAGGLLAGLLVFLMLSSVILAVSSQLEVPQWCDISFCDALPWTLFSDLVYWMIMFVMAFALYQWAPNTKVGRSEAVWGALFAASGWAVSKAVFSWYLDWAMDSYQLVYGSLGTVVALMLWIYLSALIILFGAHLSSAIDRMKRRSGPE